MSAQAAAGSGKYVPPHQNKRVGDGVGAGTRMGRDGESIYI